MLMAQAIRPPASPVGSVLSDTHSMNPGNGASSSILPGSEEGIGGRHGCPHTLAATVIYNEWIENTADLDAGRHRFAPRRRAGDGAAKDGGAFAGAPTAGHSTERAIRSRIPRPGARAKCCRRSNWWSRRLPAPEWASRPAPCLSMKGISPGSARLSGHRSGAPAGSEVYKVRIETCFRPCCRTKMSACQGYRRRDLAHRLGRKD
jgi:hypothetical protein